MTTEQRQNFIAWVVTGSRIWIVTGNWAAGVGAMAIIFLYLRARGQQ